MTHTALIPFEQNLTVNSLESYIRWAHQIPMLTAEEEVALATRLGKQGDLEAAKRLVLSHLRFVIHVARSYQGYGLPQADLIQEGTIGLMKAVKRFDPSHGVRLVSFAVYWIKAEIHEFVLRNWRIVKVATTKAQRKLFFNLRKSLKNLRTFTNEDVKNVAESLNVSEKDVRTMEMRMINCFDEAFDTLDSVDESGPSPALRLADQRFSPESAVAQQNWLENRNTTLDNAMANLDSRSQSIVRQRWLNESKSTLHELAAEFDVSAERIRQLEKNALKKLHAALGDQAEALL